MYLNIEVTAIDDDAIWGACDECAQLVRTRQIGQLRNRALAVARRQYEPKPLPRYALEGIIAQLAAFWLSVPGPVTRLRRS